MSPRDSLRADKLRSEVGAVTIGRAIVVLEETRSTNDVVLQMVNAGSPEGIVVFAEHQTAGRGQRGNKWESAAHKGLWFSVLLRPEMELKDSARLTQWASKIIASTIESAFSLQAIVKPPNDICVDGRKLAGVLVEMRAQPRAPHVGILGIGINVNQRPSDFSAELRETATSLAILHRGQVDRHWLAVNLLRNLDRTYVEVSGRSSTPCSTWRQDRQPRRDMLPHVPDARKRVPPPIR